MTWKTLLLMLTVTFTAAAGWFAWPNRIPSDRMENTADVKTVPPVPSAAPAAPGSSRAVAEQSVAPAREMQRPAPAPLNPATKTLSAIAGEFEKAKDLKALYDRLLNAATPEAKYYAAKAIQECIEQRRNPVEALRRDFEQKVAPTDTTYNLRSAALDRISEDRCAGFSSTFLNEANYRQMVAQAAEQGDIRARIAQLQAGLPQRLAAGESGGRSATLTNEELLLLRDAALSEDPDVYRRLANWWLLWQRTDGVRAGPNQETVNGAAWSAAWSLLACENGLDCGPGNRYLNMQCASQGFCGASDLTAYLQQFGLSPYQYQQAINYRETIRSAIEQRQWDWIGLGSPPTVGVTSRHPMFPRG
jgi:hypothetical protein